MTSEATYTEQLRRELVGASRRLHAGAQSLNAPRIAPRSGSSGPGVRRRRLLPLAGVVVLAAVTAVVVALMSAGGNPPAAYAVTQNEDGTVTLSLNEVLGVEPANEQLARLGVPVVVAKVEAGCDETGEPVRPSAPRFGEMIEPAKTGSGLEGLTWVIRPALIPAGDTLRLSVQLDPNSSIPALGTGMALFRGPAPRCSRPGIFYPG